MARIIPVPGDLDATFSDDVHGRLEAHEATVLGYRPEIRDRIYDFRVALFERGSLAPRVRELVRLRIAFHNQCRTCMAVRYATDELSEGEVCSLERPEEATDLSPAERAAVEYADAMSVNHHGVGDADYERLREHFDEGEIVELGLLCFYCIGYGRLAATWDLSEHLPESFQGPKGVEQPMTPWGHDVIVDGTPAARA